MGRVPNSTDDLQDAELALHRAIEQNDADALDALLDDELAASGPDGAPLSKREVLAAHRDGAMRVTEIAVEQLRVRVMSELGVTRLIATVHGTSAGTAFTTRVRCTRSWRLTSEDFGWQVVAEHTTPAPPGNVAGTP